MSSSDTLIDTKLRVPPLRSKMLNRPHLLAKLGSGKKHSVTIITGQGHVPTLFRFVHAEVSGSSFYIMS